ncbi:hypothetical protein [Kutzneria kofuensis]
MAVPRGAETSEDLPRPAGSGLRYIGDPRLCPRQAASISSR